MKKLFLIPLLIVFLASCRNNNTTEELNKSIVNKWLTEVNKENYEELFKELWTDNCKHYFNSSTEAVEFNEFKQMLDNLYTEYPVIHHEVHDIIANDDKVVAKFSAKVFHDRTMFGAPATGKEIEWNAMAIFQLSNGKIHTRWEITDLLGMYGQLGMELHLKETIDK